MRAISGCRCSRSSASSCGNCGYADLSGRAASPEQAFAGRAVTYTQESPDGTECTEVSCQPAWDDARDTVVGLYMFARNVTAERRALRSLEAQTVSDHLTGLLNRKGFDRCRPKP